MIKFGKGDTKSYTLEQHEAARKAAKARKQRGHGNNNASTNSKPTVTVFKVTRIEDIVLQLDAEKAEEDLQALKRAEEIRQNGTRTLSMEDLQALKRAAEINAAMKAQVEAAAKAQAEAEAAKSKAAEEVAAKARKRAERNQRVQARKAERQKALAGGGIDFANLFGI